MHEQKTNIKQKFLLSDESVNDYGFRLLTAGANLELFKKNPVMLYGHDRNIVLGSWDDIEVVGNAIYASTNFDMEDPTVEPIAGKVGRGFLRAASIGVDLTGAKMTKVDGIPTYSGWTLKEGSILSLGSNGNALQVFKDGVQLNADGIKVMLASASSQNNNPIDKKTMELTTAQKEQRAALNLPETATEEEVLKATKALASNVQEAKHNAATVLVEGYIAKGKVKLEQKEQTIKLATSDFANTKAFIDSLPSTETPGEGEGEGDGKKGPTPLQRLTSNKTQVAGGGSSAKETEETDPSKMSYAQLSAKNPEYLDKLMKEDKVKYDALLSDYLAEQKSKRQFA